MYIQMPTFLNRINSIQKSMTIFTQIYVITGKTIILSPNFDLRLKV